MFQFSGPKTRTCDYCYAKINKDTSENEQSKSVFYFTNSSKEDSDSYYEIRTESQLSTNTDDDAKS